MEHSIKRHSLKLNVFFVALFKKKKLVNKKKNIVNLLTLQEKPCTMNLVNGNNH